MLTTKDSTLLGAHFFGRASLNKGFSHVSRVGSFSGSLLTLSQLISDLFKNNEQGFAYDINDLSTLYQDAAGTIPVTGAGSPWRWCWIRVRGWCWVWRKKEQLLHNS